MAKHRLSKRSNGSEPYWVLFQTVWFEHALYAGHRAEGWYFHDKYEWLDWRKENEVYD